MLSTVADARWQREQLKRSLVFYKECEMGHLSYFTNKDMSYFEVDVMGQLRKYHPLQKYSFLQ